MSDFSSTSSFQPTSDFSPTSDFDVSRVEENVKAIRAVENRWRLPQLPDELKMDLAAMDGVEPQGLSDFLLGLDQDLNETQAEQEPFEQPLPFEQPRSALEEFQVIANDIAGNPVPPTKVSEDAVKKFKLDAIRRGILSPDTPIDSSWSPELNRVRKDLLYEDIDRFYAGDRAGAVDTPTLIEQLGKWTQPGGLLAAATELDLFWDFNAIGDEFSSWNKKFEKLAESTGPVDFAKNLLDAATGPIDDIVFPALNLITLASGVGAMANLGRIGFLGARAAQGGRVVKGIYSGSKLLRPQSLAAIAEPSWIGGRLAQSSRFGGLGSMMNEWRAIPTVGRIKQGVGVGMRAGFMSRAQDLMPGYQGGVSLADIGPVGDAADWLEDKSINSPLSVVPELMFAPMNIFNPGTFVGGSGILTKSAQGFLAAGGTIPGRGAMGAVGGAALGALFGDDPADLLQGVTYGALGAAFLPQLAKGVSRLPGFVQSGLLGGGIGAGVAAVTDVDVEDGVLFGAATGMSLVPLSSAISSVPNPGKWVGHASDVLARLDYSMVSQNQEIGMAYQRGMRRFFADSPEQLQWWDDTMARTNSFRHTLAEYLETDLAGADASVAYVTLAAAIDHTAMVQAGGRMSDKFHLFRNKLISQLKVIDTNGEFLVEDVARAIAMDRAGGADHTRAFRKVLNELRRHPESARELAENHNRLAEQTLKQLTSLENLPDLDPRIAVSPWTELDAASRTGVIEAYLPEALPTFGNWSKFTQQSQTIETWVNDGLLDAATFKKVVTPWGTERGVRANVHRIPASSWEADEEIVGTMIRNPRVRTKLRDKFSPLARLQPTGRFTLARKSTISKQALEQVGYELGDTIEAFEHLDALTKGGVASRLDDALRADGRTLSKMDPDELKAFISANGFGNNRKQILYVHSYMRRQGVPDQLIRAHLDQQIRDLAADHARWSGLGIDPIARNAENQPIYGLQALKAHRKAVLKKARYTAAEIDVDGAIAGIRESLGDTAADEFAFQIGKLEDDGYKLVHGVEYMMPHDLALDTPLFRDHGVREINSRTFGNFFSRRQPAVARVAQERRERAAMSAALAEIGDDFAPESGEITQAYRDLRSILLEIQDPIAKRTAERHLLNFWDKFRNAQESAFAPLRVEDLTRHQPFVIDRLEKMGWSNRQAQQIFSAIRKFRNTDFKDLGLYALEAKARAANLNVSALKWISNTSDAERFMSPTRLGTVGGAFIGQEVAVGAADENAGGDEIFGRRLAGLAAGAVGGGLLGKLATRIGGAGDVAARIRRAEQKPSWMLGDRLARFRDGMRFSLSPIFDISRYTEGMMLSRTGTPLRHADGSRVLLPGNLSPTAVKKRYGQAAFAEARDEYNRLAKTGGHADLDVLDDAGHWFAQVGIMGFNPLDWQVGAYTELRRAGFGAKDAYEAARATHSYGVKGRSAAELSANFVFFPFSFQKKVFTHLAEFLNDDLGRSILVHDGFKAYEALNEELNLDQWFEDHIPALDQLSRLNMLAYGASPGRFGGINSQLFETVGKSILLFSPIAVNVKGEEDWIELKRTVKSLVPAWNDINWMLQEAKESKGLLTAGSMPSAQIRRGYDEWNEFRADMNDWLTEQGFTWADLHNKGYLADQKQVYDAKIAELQMRYPEWVESRRNSIFNIQAIEMERNDLLRAAAANPAAAPPQAFMLAEMENKIAEVKDVLSYSGVSVDGPDGWLDAPPWAAEVVIARAVELAESNPRFIGVWKKFYEREFGPIEATL